MAKPSYKEFRDIVYKKYMGRMKGFDQDEVKDYFNSDEAEQEIRNAYKENSKLYNNGELSEEIFLCDAANSVAYCLEMMF